MRKLFSTLILTLLVATLAPGQPLIKKALLAAPQQYATLLNGTSQYWSKASPNNLDLNGAEMLSNPTFDVNVGNWLGGSGVSLSHETTIKRTGAGSAKATSDGTAGGRIQHDVINNSTTNKFTAECWVYVPSASVQKTLRIQLLSQTGGTGFTAAISIVTVVADTWTKIVLNSQAIGTQTGISFRVGYNSTPTAGDIFYVDDASLTQAYDIMMITPFKTSENYTSIGVTTFAGSTYLLQRFAANGTLTSRLNSADGVAVELNGSIPRNDGIVHLLITILDRTGNMSHYLDGVSESAPASITSHGRIYYDAFVIGATAGTATIRYKGFIMQSQFVRFNALPSDIVQTIAYINSTWKRNGLPKAYAGGTVVAHYNWRAQGTDISGNGNHLTPVASPPIIKIQP